MAAKYIFSKVLGDCISGTARSAVRELRRARWWTILGAKVGFLIAYGLHKSLRRLATHLVFCGGGSR